MFLKKFLPLLLSIVIITVFAGCTYPAIEPVVPSHTGKTDDGDGETEINHGTLGVHTGFKADVAEDGASAIAQLGAALLCDLYGEDKNTAVSPLSVITALAMLENGCAGNSLSQMESVLGSSAEELNKALKQYVSKLSGDGNVKFNTGNSVWIKNDDSLHVNGSYTDILKSVYDAETYEEDFGDETIKKINAWVNDKTDGMIPVLLDKIEDDTVMYLINALCFEAEWSEQYREDQLRTGTFTNADGTTAEAEFMNSEEGCYIETEDATGFLKYYKGGKYAFAAVLPNDGTTVKEFLSSMTGDDFVKMCKNAESTMVNTSMPKFKTTYEAELSDVLKAEGMTDIFDGNLADLSNLGSYDGGNLYVGSVLHKVYIQVDENGTKAGAATAVAVNKVTSVGDNMPKYVVLDRPFIYAIIDTETCTPIFIGAVNSLS